MPRYSAERKVVLLKTLLPPAILVLRKKLNAYWGNDSEEN